MLLAAVRESNGRLLAGSSLTTVGCIGYSAVLFVLLVFNPLYPIVHISISPRQYDNNALGHCFQWLTTQS